MSLVPRTNNSYCETVWLPRAFRPLRSAGRMLATAVSITALTMSCFGSAPTRHTDPKAKHAEPKAKQSAPAVEPAAIEAVKAMGVYLRTLDAYQVQAALSTDDVAENGQVIQSNSSVSLLAAKPNRFRADVSGDDINRLYFYDGKSFTVFGKESNFYATVPAPPTIPELVDKLTDRFNMDLPLEDLFRWGLNDGDISEILTAVDVGPTAVDGVTCEQYAFHQNGIDWQIWIQLGKYPLPRKLVIRTLTDDSKPQHSEVFTWNLAPSFDDAAFVFDPPADAHRIAIEDAGAKTSEKKK